MTDTLAGLRRLTSHDSVALHAPSDELRHHLTRVWPARERPLAGFALR